MRAAVSCTYMSLAAHVHGICIAATNRHGRGDQTFLLDMPAVSYVVSYISRVFAKHSEKYWEESWWHSMLQ